MISGHELKRLQNEPFVLHLRQLLSQNLSEKTEKNHENLHQDSLFPGKYLNLGSPEYKVETPATLQELLELNRR
jgi:hypothetical protein